MAKDTLDSEDQMHLKTTDSRYTAVGYVYNNTTEKKQEQYLSNSDNLDSNDSSNDTEYICPPSLMLPNGMITPSTEREAAIIEQTARFVAEKGAQLEILIKTKQANNKRFAFLNYDHKLHPFYRHITQLIKSAQYVPAKRITSHLTQPSNEVSDILISEPCPLKVDISTTPYGKLIEKFKQSQEIKRENKIEQVLQDVLHPSVNGTDLSSNNRAPSPESSEVIEARQRMYQELYHQYFPYYFQYCKDTYGNQKPHDILTEMARDYAASSAAAWIQSNISETMLINQKEEEEDRVIRKMAEYVAKNGQELEEIMLEKNAERFDFLLSDNKNNAKYKRYLKEEIAILRPEADVVPEPIEQTIDCIIDSYGLHSPPHGTNNGPISFRLNTKLKSSSSAILHNTHSDDTDDDFDFADQLITKHRALSTPHSTGKAARVSRFSPANPKNIEIITAAFNSDLQTHRKRKAEEFLESLAKRSQNGVM